MIPNNSQTNHNTAAPTSVVIDEIAELARFSYAPDSAMEIVMSLRMGEEVRFPYTAKDSDANCFVRRRPDKKSGKEIRPFVNGKIGKAELTFNPYRMEDFGLARCKAILILEGETCVEYARQFTIIATSFQSKGKKERQHGLELIKQAGIVQVWILPDNDSSGYKQANEIGELASKIGLDVIILNPLEVWDDMPHGGSIDDILEKSPMKDDEEVVNKITQAAIEAKRRQLEESFSSSSGTSNTREISPNNGDSANNNTGRISKQDAVKQAREVLSTSMDELTQNIILEDIRERAKISPRTWEDKFIKPLKNELKPTRLKLEIKAYLQEPDFYKQLQLKQKICSGYCLSLQVFDALIKQEQINQSTPSQITFSLDDLLNRETVAVKWVVPGILPEGEMLLLAAQAKTGKTLLACDIAYAVLAGGEVIGENTKKGKILLISSDESISTTSRRLIARGFDLLPQECRQNFQVMPHLDLSNLSTLESQLDDFRPDLVIIDSLTSITMNLGISENTAEFAQYIYKLKNLLGKYGAASILIHHTNKDKEAKGINKVSGSARITAAVWGIAQLESVSQSDITNNHRNLLLIPREGEARKYFLELNDYDQWASHGIFKFHGEAGDENGQKKTQGERVLELLRHHAPDGLERREIDEFLGIGASLKVVLNRLSDSNLVSRRRSKHDARRWIYALPIAPATNEKNCQQPPKEILKNSKEGALPPPPPTVSVSDVNETPTTIENIGLQKGNKKGNKRVTKGNNSDLLPKKGNKLNLDTPMDTEIGNKKR